MKVNTMPAGDINSADVLSQKGVRDVNVKRSDALMRVQFDKIVIRTGFNLRIQYGDMEDLAQSIESEGLKVPIKVDVMKDGSVVITDGERRYRAIGLLRQKSLELAERFEYIEAMANPKEATELDRLVTMMVHNSGKPFEIIEEAEGYKRMAITHGLSISAISARVGKPVTYVKERLDLANLDEVEKQQVIDGKVSATAKIKQVKKTNNAEKRKADVEDSAAKGKKLKVKDVTGKPDTAHLDNALALIVQLGQIVDGRALNILMEIDAEVRHYKKDLKS